MTPQQKAENIARTYLNPIYSHGDVIEAIRVALVEAVNEETEKRREAERATNGTIVIYHDEMGTRIRAWNPTQKRWYESSMIAVGEVAT